VWQHGGVRLSPRGVAAGAGVGGCQEDALGVMFFWINETHYLQCLLLSLGCWLSVWMIVTLTIDRCFSSLLFSLYTYTYTYAYCYYYCILYSLVLTKPAPAWVPVKASFSTSDTIVTLYRHRSSNRFVSLEIDMSISSIQASKSQKQDFRHFSWAKVCYSNGMSNSRISFTWNGARRSS